MLVSLDNAQLVALSDPRTDKAVVREFLTTWERRGCVLALKEATIREFIAGEGEDAANRQKALESLQRIRRAAPEQHVYDVEVMALGLSLAIGESKRRFEAMILSRLRDHLTVPLPLIEIPQLLKARRQRLAELRKHDEYVAGLMNGLDRQMPWPPAHVGTMTEEHALMHWESAFNDWPEPRRSIERDRVHGAVRHYFRKPKDKRGFYRELLGLAAWRVTSTAPLFDLPEMWYMRELWEMKIRPQLLAKGVLRGQAHAAHVASQLSPYRVPAISLRMANLREQMLDKKWTFSPGDIADDHCLMFAPYSDLACVDKRTFEWILRARARNDELIFPGVGQNLIDARSLAHVSKAIAEHK